MSLELHGPTKDTVNPAYHIVTNQHYKETDPELAEEPNDDYEEVNRPPEKLEVKMTPNPAYAVP